MTDPFRTGSNHLHLGKWVFLSLALLGSSWVVYGMARARSADIVERWGPTPDVVDSLGLSHYLCNQLLPWYTGILFLDYLTLLSLVAPNTSSWRRWLKITVVILLIPSALYHAFLLFLAFLFS
ncbi:MAG: hypothetical protein U0798_05715 [Gemmataceae bacterium]